MKPIAPRTRHRVTLNPATVRAAKRMATRELLGRVIDPADRRRYSGLGSNNQVDPEIADRLDRI